MPYHSLNANPVSQLAELYAEVVEDPGGLRAEVKVTLSLQPDEIDIDDFSVGVSIREAYLVVTADGQQTEHSTKHGMRNAGERISSKRTLEKMVSAVVSNEAAIEGVAEANFAAVDASLKASAKVSKSHDETRPTSLTERRELDFEHIPVEAIGSDRWKISNEGGAPLRGYYLTDERLCVLVRNTVRPNLKAVQISLKAKPKDVDVEVMKDRRLLKLSINKTKLLGILAAKHLGTLSESSEEALTLASYEGRYED